MGHVPGAADRVLVGDLLTSLTRRQRRIIHLQFWAESTQQEIADDIGVSQVHVSRLLQASLRGLRAA